jgi:arginyl-tRNA synthetase
MIKATVQSWLLKKGFEGKIEHPSVEKFGDLAIRGDIEIKDLEIIEKVDKMAGFTNIWIKNDVLVKEAEKILDGELVEELKENGRGKTMVIDYSAPNIAKPFGIGHLRSTNIGQALYNIYQILGWKCIGDNHLGDWGTQFGKMIAAIKHWGMKNSIEGLEKLYVRFHEEAETDETLQNEARAWFAKLEQGDKEAKKIWQECVDISLAEFNRVYEILGVKIDNAYGEAFYLPMLPEVILEMKAKGLTKESEGALIVEIEGLPPAMLLKSDGATTYFTRDMATVKFRKEKWNPDLIIYEVGSEQNLHFKQVFAAAKLMDWGENFVHIGHGLIRWKEGKFSTRKGDTIHLAEVIETAKIEAKKIAPANSESEIEAVAIGAIKLNDLVADPKRDIIFDWDKVMSMEGNSGPYLQYTYARCKSVLAKAKIEMTNNKCPMVNPNEEEKSLLRYFYQYGEKMIEAAERYSPAVLAEYLLILARKYNEFYGKHRIIGEPQEEQRLFLTEVTAKIIKDGLTILGIKTLPKM